MNRVWHLWKEGMIVYIGWLLSKHTVPQVSLGQWQVYPMHLCGCLFIARLKDPTLMLQEAQLPCVWKDGLIPLYDVRVSSHKERFLFSVFPTGEQRGSSVLECPSNPWPQTPQDSYLHLPSLPFSLLECCRWQPWCHCDVIKRCLFCPCSVFVSLSCLPQIRNHQYPVASVVL